MKRKIVVSLMILMFPMLVGCQKETMTLKIDSVTVEYGSSISVKAEDYLKNEKDFLDKVEVAVNAENEKDKKYPPKGEYELLLKHDDNIEKVKVIVKDTIAPKLEIKDKYTIEYNSKLDQKELQKFSTSCKKMIKDELNISIEEKQIMNILKQNQFWNKMIHRMKNKLSYFSKIFVFIYSIMQSIFFRIIILLWILLCFFRLYNLNKSGFSLVFSIVLLVKCLIDYMMIGLIEISKSFYIKMLNIPISSISIDSYLIVAMVSLMIGMILFVWHIYKAE